MIKRLPSIEPRLDPPECPRPLAVRLGWLALIWAASVAALGVVALTLRWWID
ncbi:MAG: DUF2474 domain-containing protein [Sphingomicrobium sp.]